MDERNGVVNGTVLPNSDHSPIAYQMMHDQHLNNFRYPPGFAMYMISAVKASEHWGRSYFFWRLVEDCLSTAITTVLLMGLMLRLTNSAWIGCAAIAMLLYNLTYSAGTAADLAMASFLPWFFGGLLLFIRGIQSKSKRGTVPTLLAGVLIGISGFIRPDILLFLPFIGAIFCIYNFLQRNKPLSATASGSKTSILFASFIGFGLVLTPWLVFTSLRSGTAVVYSTNFVPSHLDGLSRFPGNPVSETFAKSTWDLKSVTDVVATHYALFKRYPSDWTALWLQKIWRPWYASDSGQWDALLAVQSQLILPPVVCGMYLWWKKRGLDLALVFGLGVTSYFWLVATVVLSVNRYLAPVYPFLGMFAGFAAQVLCRTLFPSMKTSGVH